MIYKKKVLIVSGGEKLVPVLKELMPINEYVLTFANTVQEAKNKLRAESFQFAIMQTPLKDAFGIKSAQEIVHAFSIGIILLVKNDIFDQVTYRLKEEPIFVVSLPTSKQSLYQCICLMNSLVFQMQKAENEIKKLRKKLADQQLISQAKLLLIEKYQYTEEKAHHYIEKRAMDACITKVEVANEILHQK